MNLELELFVVALPRKIEPSALVHHKITYLTASSGVLMLSIWTNLLII